MVCGGNQLGCCCELVMGDDWHCAIPSREVPLSNCFLLSGLEVYERLVMSMKSTAMP